MLTAMLSGMMLAANFILRGGSNLWIPQNVRSLGCFSAFYLDPYTGAYTDRADVVGFNACFMCTTNFVVLRGSQCVCIEHFGHLIRVDDSYCDILCDESNSTSGEPLFCGGNLGANLYCNTMAGGVCKDASPDETIADIYRDFGTNGQDEFQLLEPCLEFGCGQPPYPPFPPIAYMDYFPNLNPKDCVIYCTLMETTYAHAGWVYHTINGGKGKCP